jgi:hypothetical protein
MLSAAAVVLLLLTAPAYAQTPNVNLMPELPTKSPEEKEQDAIKDKAYKDSEEDSRRQDLFRSLGHRAQHRCAQGHGGACQEEQDRQQQPVIREARSDDIATGLSIFDLTPFLDANQSPPGSSPGQAFAGKRSGESGE